MFNDKGGSRTDTLIKLVLVFFLSLLSFSVGTFVGKQFSDSQHKIAEMENPTGDTDRSTASIPPDATKAEVGKAISDEEISKLSDEFVKKEKQEGTTAPDAAAAKNDTGGISGMSGAMVGEDKKALAEKKATIKKMGVVKDEIAEVSKRIAKGEQITAPTKMKSRYPSSLPEAGSTIGKYTVQVSSYPTEKEAQDHAQELKDKGLSAFYVKAEVGGKTWFRVGVGIFDNRKAAMEYRTKVMQEAELKSAIVQKIMPEGNQAAQKETRKTAADD